MAGNPSVLLPIQNGPVNQCRQQDVKFVRVQVSVDYTYTLQGVSPIRLDFYVELPQTSTPMTNGAGNAYTFTSCANSTVATQRIGDSMQLINVFGFNILRRLIFSIPIRLPTII